MLLVLVMFTPFSCVFFVAFVPLLKRLHCTSYSSLSITNVLTLCIISLLCVLLFVVLTVVCLFVVLTVVVFVCCCTCLSVVSLGCLAISAYRCGWRSSAVALPPGACEGAAIC